MSIIKSEIIASMEILCIMDSAGKVRTEPIDTIELLKVTIIEDIKQSSIRRKVNFLFYEKEQSQDISSKELSDMSHRGTGYLLMDSLVLQYNKKYYKAKLIVISSEKHIKL
jgi:hypothetical protein